MRHCCRASQSTKMATKIVPLTRDSSTNFAWSFKPILVWMKLIGIDLNSSQQLRSRICRYSQLLHRVFTLLLISGHGIYKGLKICGVVPKSPETYPSSKSLTLERTIELYFITYITYNLATHVLLMAVTAVKWKELWQTLQQIEDQFLLDNDHFQQCRKVVIIGLSMLALVISFLFFSDVVNF